jgi:hypothetical protein
MTQQSYIIIAESGGLTRWFKVTHLYPIIDPAKSINRTVDGGRDVAYGGVYESHQLVLRVPQTGSGSYGSLADLKTIFSRNNPSGTPSTRFTYTDNWGTAHSNAFFAPGATKIEPITTMLEGSSAWYLIPVEIMF